VNSRLDVQPLVALEIDVYLPLPSPFGLQPFISGLVHLLIRLSVSECLARLADDITVC
jgi:hypothetical protein